MKQSTINNLLVKKYQFYIKTFQVEENQFWIDISNRIQSPLVNYLELSHKIENGKIYSGRVNIYYNSLNQLKLQNILNFIHSHIDISYNQGMLKTLNSLYLSKSPLFIYGIDLRQNIIKSRFKLYFLIRDQETILKLLDTHGHNDKMLSFFHEERVLVCVDFEFSGNVKLKIYSCFLLNGVNERQNREYLNKLVADPITKILDECLIVDISFSSSNFEPIFSFIPRPKASFLKYLPLPSQFEIVNQYYNKINTPIHYITLHEKEIVNQNITQGNLYY